MNLLARASQAIAQNELILAVLAAVPGEWVPMPELARAGGCYAVHSRVANPREMGHRIECRIQQEGRIKHSSYRLIPPGHVHQAELSL
jgi:hypothetical protein